MKKCVLTQRLTTLTCAGAVIAFASAAQADWNIGDPYKMHYPQLPDLSGWDVNFMQPKVLADDWRCTETGPVSAVHLWFSSRQDQPFQIASVHLSIHKDVPATPTGGFSHPGELLWQTDLAPNYFNWRIWGTGQQGWYDPNLGTAGVFPNDHLITWQLNVPNIPDPFFQQVGNIYWLDVSLRAIGPTGAETQLGWKTSLEHFNDDAVWSDFNAAGGVDSWNELRDPFTQQSLDLAFVVVPEPGAWMLGGLGSAFWFFALRRRGGSRQGG